ncbi:MAG: hypothetical protein ACYDHW_04110 [Syntrophorhabdaceae bacterium]
MVIISIEVTADIMGLLIEDRTLRDKIKVFRDRTEAGRKLGEMLESYLGSDGLILAIPSGGVPVAKEIARMILVPLDLIIVRKLQIPFEPEAGFGALDRKERSSLTTIY